jgi:DNA-directed RNA polymerase specialized sigma24 family protein
MIRGSKRRPELTVSDLSAEEDDWIEQQLADSQQPSVENNLVAADLADRVLSVLSPEDQQALLMIDGEQASIKEVA